MYIPARGPMQRAESHLAEGGRQASHGRYRVCPDTLRRDPRSAARGVDGGAGSPGGEARAPVVLQRPVLQCPVRPHRPRHTGSEGSDLLGDAARRVRCRLRHGLQRGRLRGAAEGRSRSRPRKSGTLAFLLGQGALARPSRDGNAAMPHPCNDGIPPARTAPARSPRARLPVCTGGCVARAHVGRAWPRPGHSAAWSSPPRSLGMPQPRCDPAAIARKLP